MSSRSTPSSTKRLVRRAVLVLVPALVFAGWFSQEMRAAATLAVLNARVDEPINGSSAAVRMSISNRSGGDDALVGVWSSRADRAAIHRSVTTGGRATMDDLEAVEVPDGGEVEFSAGGLHVMLYGIDPTLAIGEEVDLRLTFRRAGTVEVTAPVVPIGT